MEENNEIYNKNLYRWKKHNSKLNAKIKESDNIQSIHQWLRKVEDVSEKAIVNTFNPTNSPNPKTKQVNNAGTTTSLSNLIKKHTSSAVDQLSFFEAKSKKKISSNDPFAEAHDLISEWMTDKIRLDMDDDFYNYVDVDEMNKFTDSERILNELKAEILSDNVEYGASFLDIKGVDYEKYDEGYIAQDIINKMLRKNLVDPAKLLKSDESKKGQIDVQMKIEARHRAVKENRDKRHKDLEKKRREMLEKKEIETKAREIVLKEENDKKMRGQIEQQLIEQEVQKLRLEMAEQRRKEEEMRNRKKEIESIEKEREKQEMMNLEKKLEISSMENAMEAKRNEMAEKRAEDLVDTYLKTKKMRRIQKTFSAWYGLVIEQRLKIGKAKALFDWKLSYRVFNAWKKIKTTEKVKKEQELHQNLIKIENLKNARATNYYHTKLIEKCLESWKIFVRSELETKRIQNEKMKTKNKMQKFLEAAVVIGKSDQNEPEQQQQQQENENSLNTSRTNNSARPKTSRRPVSSRLGNISKKKVQIEENLENEDFDDDLINNLKNENKSVIDKRVKEMMWPWMKKQLTNNNFDNRFKAQEKLLQEQHQMIKEQQKLIEDLKFQQNQAAFKEQISLLEQIKAKQDELEKMQKIQFKQEKKLLREKKMEKQEKKKSDLENEEANELEDLLKEDEEEEESADSDELNKDSSRQLVNLNAANTSRTNLITNRSGQSSRLDSFTKNMEDRAKQREQMKKEREDLRKKKELEKLELIKAQQEEKLRIEEEERRKKTDELREKRRTQKELDEKRNVEKLKEQQSLMKAELFYRKYLLRYYCLNGLKQLIQAKVEKCAKADEHYKKVLFGKIISAWHSNTQLEMDRKNKMADELNNKHLIKNCYFNGLKKFGQYLLIENAKAGRFYKYHIKVKLFNAWKIYREAEKLKSKEYELIVKEHNLMRVQVKFFRIWREFPAEAKRLRQRQKRIDELRSRVKEMIPDFYSNQSASNSTNLNSIESTTLQKNSQLIISNEQKI